MIPENATVLCYVTVRCASPAQAIDARLRGGWVECPSERVCLVMYAMDAMPWHFRIQKQREYPPRSWVLLHLHVSTALRSVGE